MANLTITEALAEIATIDKRLPKKQEAILRFVVRDERQRDPLEKHSGSTQFIQSERQSVHDLNERRIALRRAITQANAETTLTVSGVTRTIADWLVWKREVYQRERDLLNQINSRIESGRGEARKRGVALVSVDTGSDAGNIIACVDEQTLAREIEALEDTHGQLDGLLSLKNATTTVAV